MAKKNNEYFVSQTISQKTDEFIDTSINKKTILEVKEQILTDYKISVEDEIRKKENIINSILFQFLLFIKVHNNVQLNKEYLSFKAKAKDTYKKKFKEVFFKQIPTKFLFNQEINVFHILKKSTEIYITNDFITNRNEEPEIACVTDAEIIFHPCKNSKETDFDVKYIASNDNKIIHFIISEDKNNQACIHIENHKNIKIFINKQEAIAYIKGEKYTEVDTVEEDEEPSENKENKIYKNNEILFADFEDEFDEDLLTN
jgi:hypothetical protein